MNELDRRVLERISAEGASFDAWRARRLLTDRTEPAPSGWAADQTPQGGWRSLEMNYTGPNMGRTSVMLMNLIAAGLLDQPETQRTIQFLWATQQPDGRWTEDPAQLAGNPPPWNMPGDEKVDIWETANTAAGLAAAGYARDPRIERALTWLQAHAAADGTFPGYIHGTFAMAALHYLRREAEAAEVYLQASLRILTENRHEEWFDVMDMTWPLALWAIAGIPREHPVLAAYADELYGRRLPDGTWPTRYAGFALSFTLEALELKYRHGRVGGIPTPGSVFVTNKT